MSALRVLPLIPTTKRPRLAPNWSRCIICQNNTHERNTTPTQRGLSCLTKVAESRKDTVFARLQPDFDNLFVNDVKWHPSCYAKYTHKSNNVNTPGPVLHTRTVCQTRLSSDHASRFDPSLCIICQRDRSHHGKHGSSKLSTIESEEGALRLQEVAHQRQDEVFLRINGIDLLRHNVKYHNTCRSSYVSNRNLSYIFRKVQNSDSFLDETFLKLAKEINIPLREGYAIELSSVCARFNALLTQAGHMENVDNRRLKTLLLRQYGEHLGFQQQLDNTKCHVMYDKSVKPDDIFLKVCQLASEQEELRTHQDLSFDDTNNTTDPTINSAEIFNVAKRIRTDLKRQSTNSYQHTIDEDEAAKCVPESLYMLLKFMMTDAVEVDVHAAEKLVESQDDIHKAILSIGQDIMYHVSKHRYITPKHSGLALAVHQATRSKSLIQLLHAAGHCISYEQLQRIDNTIATLQLESFKEKGGNIPPNLKPNAFVQFAGDNIDLLEETLDGQGTLHATQMVAFQTVTGTLPHREAAVTVPVPGRDKTLKASKTEDLRELFAGTMSSKRPKPVLPRIQAQALLADCKEGNFHLDDLCWLVCRNTSAEKQNVPAWTAFNQHVTVANLQKTLIGYMPIIRSPAHEYDTLWTVIQRAQAVAKHLGQLHVVLTFDQALYCKAKELCWLRPNESKHVIVRLGGFHTALNFLQCIGRHFSDSGLRDIWVEAGLYNEVTAEKIISGKTWNRSIRAHKLTFEALWRCLSPLLAVWSSTEFEATLATITAAFADRDTDVLPAYKDVQLEMPKLLHVVEQFASSEAENVMSTYWMMYMKMVSTLLTFVRAEREANWSLHISTLAEMLPWFMVYDHTNYARWAPVYLLDMQQLSITAPEVFQQFDAGNFVVQESIRSFSGIATDQALEHVNRTGKVAGGLVGISRTDSAMDRWCLTYNERSSLTEDTYKMFGVRLDMDNWDHKEHGPSRMNRDEQDVLKLQRQFEHGGIFKTTGPNLICLSTKDQAPLDIKADLLSAFARGKQLVKQYVEMRLTHNAAEGFFDRLARAKSKTFTDMYMVKSRSIDGKQHVIKADRDLYRRLLASAQSGRELNVRKLVEHELAPIPLSLASTDGNLNPADKAPLMHKLESGMVHHELPRTTSKKCVIIDAMALVQAIGKPCAKTFGELADVFINAVTAHFKTCSRIDVVFDRYRVASIKHTTRVRRAGKKARQIRRIVEDRSVPLPFQWQSFINMDENKENLAKFLSTELMRFGANLPNECELVVAGGFEDEKTVVCSTGRDVTHLMSTQEEADTRIALHASDAAKCLFSQVVVCSKDTDVFLILISFAKQLPKEIWFSAGTAKQPKLIPVHQVSRSISGEICNSLLAFHAISGCDTTSQFTGHGKKLCWKAFIEHPELLAGLGRGSLSPDVISDVEKFVCQLYCPSSTHCSVDDLRAQLFFTMPPEKLPPTHDALRQHTQRAHYQSMVWLNALNAMPNLPEPTELGWEEVGDKLKPILSTLEAVPAACIELVSCHCKTKCHSAHCSCRKHKMPCTHACTCKRECLNTNLENDSDDES